MESSNDQDQNVALVEEYKKAKEEHGKLFAMLDKEENPYRFNNLMNRFGKRKWDLEERMTTIWDDLPPEVRDNLDPPPARPDPPPSQP